MKIERLTSVSCGTEPHKNGNLVSADTFWYFLNDLEDDDDIKTIMRKIKEMKDQLK